MNREQERALFESAAAEHFGDEFERDESGFRDYCEIGIEQAWIGFLLRAAHEASRGAAPEPLSVDIAYVTPALHQSTRNLVARFAMALAEKLLAAQEKYGYSDGWMHADWLDECRAHLIEHVAKGDPRDVAAYCAFLWHHGASTASAPAAQPSAEPPHE